jgi:hypothetical protein
MFSRYSGRTIITISIQEGHSRRVKRCVCSLERMAHHTRCALIKTAVAWTKEPDNECRCIGTDVALLKRHIGNLRDEVVDRYMCHTSSTSDAHHVT